MRKAREANMSNSTNTKSETSLPLNQGLRVVGQSASGILGKIKAHKAERES